MATKTPTKTASKTPSTAAKAPRAAAKKAPAKAAPAPREVSHEIQMIQLERIHPNPRNPRKNLGNLQELADSIRAQGLRQNLLVVPHPDIEGEFMLVIGQRRHAAAKPAGLTEVPCAVDVLSTSEQLVLMSVENVQRAQLTVVEEAEWLQGLLDLGDLKPADLPKQTGLSRKVIDARLPVAKLPDAAKKQVAAGKVTLEDVARVESARDLLGAEDYEKALQLLGRPGDRWEIDNLIHKAKSREALAEVVEKYSALGFRIVESYSEIGAEYPLYIGDTSRQEPEEGDVLVREAYRGILSIYRLQGPDGPQADPEAVARREAEMAAEAELKIAVKVSWEHRRDFVLALTRGTQKPPLGKDDEALVRELFVRELVDVAAASSEFMASWLLPNWEDLDLDNLPVLIATAVNSAGDFRWMLAWLAAAREERASAGEYAALLHTPSYEMYPGRTWGDNTAYVYRSDQWAPVARWYELLEFLGYQPTPYETEQLTALRQALADEEAEQ